MLKELAEMLNEKFNLEGEDLELAVFTIGAALTDTMATMKASGKMDSYRMSQTECYDLSNYFNERINNTASQ